MKNLLLTISLCICGAIGNAKNSYNGPEGNNPPTVAELIIMHGESNAAGAGLNTQASSTELASRSSVKILNNTTLAFQSLDVGSNNNIATFLNTATQHGFEIGLANSVESGTLGATPVYLVKCAKSGSQIKHWLNGAPEGYWNENKARIDAAIAYLNGQGMEYRITVWQSIGLNDWVQYDGNPNYPEQWKTDMNTFRAQFRAAYGADIPFLLTKFSESVSGFPTEWNTAMQELSDEDNPVGRAIDVTSAAFNSGDNSHWSYAGLKTIAGRMVTGMNSIWGTSTSQTTYYVAPNGNNSNPGTITAPFATWDKLSTVMVAGDLAYIRGGTYRTTKPASSSVHYQLQNLQGTASSMIKIFAYPGEKPVFNLDNITPTASDPTAVIMSNCRYVHLKGLRITGLKQHTGGNGISRGFDMQSASNCTIEFIELDNIGGYGYILSNGSNDNYFLNCDAHHMDDRQSNPGAWGGSNGFQCTGGTNATRNTFEGCRAWWISDDGFDLYGVNGVFTFKNCWSFWNGYQPGTFSPAGDGDGFKLGPDNGGVHNTLLRTLTNCVAFENKQHGFNQNAGDMKYKLYNNTSFKNGNTGYMWDFVSPAPVQDFKNNISYNDPSARRGAETNGSYNSWSGGVTLSAGDFLSVSSTGVNGARQSDGSLPILNFLRLAPASDLINAGINVGLPFVGSAPDRGAFENGTVLPVKLTDLEASLRASGVLVQWATLTEENSDYFLVERSTDGLNFETLGTVTANGNSAIRIDYTYTDMSPKPGINYYRLKMTDLDGQYEYSGIVSVSLKDNSNGSFIIQTSDMSNNMIRLNVNSTKAQSAKLGLYDGRGRLLFTADINLQKGTNNFTKPVFAAGSVYYCKIMTGDETKTVSLLKR